MELSRITTDCHARSVPLLHLLTETYLHSKNSMDNHFVKTKHNIQTKLLAVSMTIPPGCGDKQVTYVQPSQSWPT